MRGSFREIRLSDSPPITHIPIGPGCGEFAEYYA